MQYPTDDSAPLPLREVRAALKVYLKDDEAKERVVRAASGALRQRRHALGVRELIGDVVGDVFSGELELVWDSSVEQKKMADAMAKHLIAELRRRAKRSHRATQHLVPLESLVDQEIPVPHEAEAEVDAEAEARMSRFERGLPVLRERTSDDAPVAKLLALYESGLEGRAAAVHAGMLPGVRYRAKRRLLVLARAIDREILDRDIASAMVTPIGTAQHGARRGVMGAGVARVADVAAEPSRVRRSARSA